MVVAASTSSWWYVGGHYHGLYRKVTKFRRKECYYGND
jgi:hypothetical protein